MSSLVNCHKAQLKAAIYTVLEKKGCLTDDDIVSVLDEIVEEFNIDA